MPNVEDGPIETLYEGKFLTLKSRDTWEYVERPNCSAIVAVIPITRQGELVYIDQFRIPVNSPVVELPAGLVGDTDPNDDILSAANRELEEETGYRANKVEMVFAGPISAGMSTEHLSYVIAWELDKVGDGGGVDEGECINVHTAPLHEAKDVMLAKQQDGFMIDPKVFAAFAFLAGHEASRAHQQ